MIKKILIVVGTRPNFIKVTRFRDVVAAFTDLEVAIVHTGQHFDHKMANVFFEQFNLKPDFFLDINLGSAIIQMADIMVQLEKLMHTYKPTLVMVVGDVNSTMAAAITANKMSCKLAHLESGLRSFDLTMPEEHNRIVADQLSDYFFVTEPSGVANLLNEGKDKSRIFFVGNTMIDTMVKFSDQIENADVLEKMNLKPKSFVLMTIHRPATVDTEEGLLKLLSLIEEISKTSSIVFPIHPRTLKNAENFGLAGKFKSIKELILTEPMDYFAFQKLIKYAECILTDSGGIQEESTFLGVPCLTLRNNTERPITTTEGTNKLVPFDINIIKSELEYIRSGTFKKGKTPALWDGKATERVLEHLHRML